MYSSTKKIHLLDTVVTGSAKTLNNIFDEANANEIENLLDFALDLSGFCIAIISSVSKIPELMNITDWRITLTRVRYGLTVE